MKQTDLRVGNWVFYEETIDDHEPRQINGSGIALFEDWKDRYEPITLDEKWLLKFGFKKEDGEYFNFHLDTFCLEVFGTSLPKEGWSFRFRSYGNETTIKYVHQLQNLYYALTGEELIAK